MMCRNREMVYRSRLGKSCTTTAVTYGPGTVRAVVNSTGPAVVRAVANSNGPGTVARGSRMGAASCMTAVECRQEAK